MAIEWIDKDVESNPQTYYYLVPWRRIDNRYCTIWSRYRWRIDWPAVQVVGMRWSPWGGPFFCTVATRVRMRAHRVRMRDLRLNRREAVSREIITDLDSINAFIERHR